MRTTKYFVMAALVFGFVALGTFRADDKPKHSIKEVMKLAHKDGLMKRVASGKGDKEDAAKLVELYTALCQNKAPKGDQEEWVTRCKKMIAIAKEAGEGKKGAGKALVAAANCGGCHKLHK